MTVDSNTGLPNTWASIPLGELVQSEKGRKPRREQPTPSDAFSIPYINIEAFEDGTVRSWTDGDGCRLCDEADFLMVWDGSRSGLVGKAVKGALGSTLVKIRFDGIENSYAYYFLQSKYLEINTRAKGSGTPHVDPDLLWNYRFPIAPSNEQRRIVAKIERLFSELDAGLDSLRTALEQVRAYRRSVLNHTFRLIGERIRLDAVSNAVGGFAFKSTTFLPEGRYQVLRMGNIRPGEIRLAESPVFVDEVDPKVRERSLLKRGDVLVTLTGTRNKRDYGYTAIVKSDDCLVNQRIAYLRFVPDYLPEFFLYFSWTQEFRDQFFADETGNVGQGNVGMGAIRASLVPRLPLDEQRRAVSRLDAAMTAIEKLEADIGEQVRMASALRQAILERAFSGNLVEQNVGDEPALELLERIRGTRGADPKRPRKNKNSKKEAA